MEGLAFITNDEDSLLIIKEIIKQHKINLVVTNEEKPKGRGLKIISSKIADEISKLDIKCVKVKNINREETKELFQALQIKLAIVYNFGQMINKALLSIPRDGFFNIHPSLLPKYRGASPIQTAIINGEPISGFTLFKMDEFIDHGPILYQEKIEITQDDTAVKLKNKILALINRRINDIISLIEAKDYVLTPQDEAYATYTRKFVKRDGLIDWSQPAQKIYNLIRALIPWPGAYTFFQQGGKNYRGNESKKIKLNIIKANLTSSVGNANGLPGSVVKITKSSFVVKCGMDTLLEVVRVKPEAKKEMNAGDFVNGYRIQEGSVLG